MTCLLSAAEHCNCLLKNQSVVYIVNVNGIPFVPTDHHIPLKMYGGGVEGGEECEVAMG